MARRTRRKQRKSKSSRRRRRGGDGGSCSGPGKCTSNAANSAKNLCLSYEYNSNAPNDSNCTWTEAQTKTQSNPGAKKMLSGMFKRVRNIEGKKKSEAALAKYGLGPDGNKIPVVEQPTVEQPTVEESHDSPCEDDDSYVSPTNTLGIPLCKMIRSRKAKLKAEPDKEKRKEMLKKLLLNCTNKGATYCKKTCNKCPKKPVVSEQPPPQPEITEPEPVIKEKSFHCISKNPDATPNKKKLCAVKGKNEKKCGKQKHCQWVEQT